MVGSVTARVVVVPVRRVRRDKVRVGKQVWAARNLDTGKSEDEVKSDGEWKQMFDYDAAQTARAAWCYYDNDRANGAKFGRIYAPHDLYKLCPRESLWRVPEWDDWAELLRSCGVSELDINKKVVTGDAAVRAVEAMQSAPFNAVLAGSRYADSAFSGSGVTFHGATSQFRFAVLGDFDAARGAYTIYTLGYSMQQMSVPTLKYYNTSPIIGGVSVRLIEEERVSGLRCAKVGAQVWMAENWDGDMAGAIKQAQSAEAWEQADANGVPAWCYHDQNPGNTRGWGKLYNKHVLNGSKKAFPAGWRAPTFCGRDDANQVLQRRRGASAYTERRKVARCVAHSARRPVQGNHGQ